MAVRHECRFTLTCVRHGETDANVAGIVQGQGVDSSINAAGTLQSEKLGRVLKDEKFDLVLSSDLTRARQTCAKILELNAHSDVEVTYDRVLRERTFGVMEGRYYHELQHFAFPSEDVEETNLPQGAESLKDVEKRADDFFKYLCVTIKDLKSSSNTNVLAVSHGGFLACLFKCFEKTYGCSFPRGSNPGYISLNTCRSKFDVTVDGGKITIECTCLNDSRHLSL